MMDQGQKRNHADHHCSSDQISQECNAQSGHSFGAEENHDSRYTHQQRRCRHRHRSFDRQPHHHHHHHHHVRHHPQDKVPPFSTNASRCDGDSPFRRTTCGRTVWAKRQRRHSRGRNEFAFALSLRRWVFPVVVFILAIGGLPNNFQTEMDVRTSCGSICMILPAQAFAPTTTTTTTIASRTKTRTRTRRTTAIQSLGGRIQCGTTNCKPRTTPHPLSRRQIQIQRQGQHHLHLHRHAPAAAAAASTTQLGMAVFLETIAAETIAATAASSPLQAQDLADYAPAATSLFNNMKLPAAVVTAGMISLGFATGFPELPRETPENRHIFTPRIRRRCEALKRLHIVVALIAVTSELIVVMWAAVEVNQLTEKRYALAASVWDLIQRDCDLAWSAVNSHFVLGIIGFVFMLTLRAYVMLLAAEASNALLTAASAGTGAALCLMISIVNRGVESGGGNGERYGRTIVDLLQHYVVLLYRDATQETSPGPLQLAAIVLEVVSLVYMANVLVFQNGKAEYPPPPLDESDDSGEAEECPVVLEWLDAPDSLAGEKSSSTRGGKDGGRGVVVVMETTNSTANNTAVNSSSSNSNNNNVQANINNNQSSSTFTKAAVTRTTKTKTTRPVTREERKTLAKCLELDDEEDQETDEDDEDERRRMDSGDFPSVNIV